MQKRKIFSVLAILALAAGAQINLPLEVCNWADIARTGDVVTAGVPLPQGAVTDLSRLRMVDGGGSTVPAQFRALTRWYREKHAGVAQTPSVKWVLCDFQADVAARNKTAFTLKDDNTATPSTALSVTDAAGSVTVVTGPLKFAVSKTRFNLFDGAWLDANGNGQFETAEQVIAPGNNNTAEITAGDWAAGGCVPGTAHNTLREAPERVVIEEQGPLKTVIRVEGRHFAASNGVSRGLYGYQVFITAWAGKPYVEVQWALTNTYVEGDRPETGATPYTVYSWPFSKYGLNLSLNLNTAAQNYVLLGSGEVSGALSATPVRLLQNRSGFTLTGASGGTTALGGALVSDGSLGLMAAVRDFAPNAPKALTVAQNRLSIELFPDSGRGAFWLDPLSRKNLRMRIGFFKNAAVPGQLLDFWKKTDAPLRMLASREWYHRTGAWERGCGVPAFPAWNRRTPSAWSRMPKTSSAGWENYGTIEEFNGAGDHWNLTSVFHRYLMTGNPADFEGPEASTFYFNDMVPVQTGTTRWEDFDFLTDPFDHLSEMMSMHSPMDPHDYLTVRVAFPGFAFHRRNFPDQAHMPQKELLEYYCLTGDWATRASLESEGVRAVGLTYYGLYGLWSPFNYSARGNAPVPVDSICGVGWGVIRTIPRACLVMLDAYEVTGDARYEYPAKVQIYNLRNMTRRSPIGYMAGAEPFDPSYFGEAENIWKASHPGAATPYSFYASEFMFGICHQGMYHYWELTRDEAIRDALIHSAKGQEQRSGMQGDTYLGLVYEGWGDVWCDGKRLSDVGLGGAFTSSMCEVFGGLGFAYLASGRKDIWTMFEDGVPFHYNNYSALSGYDPKSIVMWDAIFRHDSVDTVPPSAVTDLSASLVPGTGVKLDFSAPGGNGSTGTAAQYQIKFAKAPMVDFVKRWDPADSTGWPDLRAPLPYSDTALYAKARDYLKTEISFWASDNVTGEPAPSPAGAAVAHTLDFNNTGGKLESNTLYYFAMVAYDSADNVSGISNVVSATTGEVGIENRGGEAGPLFLTNAPNPFNPCTRLRFRVPAAASNSPVSVRIYDGCGRLVRTLAQGPLAAGVQTLAWDGRDAAQRPAGNGVYLCRLCVGKKVLNRKLVLIQ